MTLFAEEGIWLLHLAQGTLWAPQFACWSRAGDVTAGWEAAPSQAPQCPTNLGRADRVALCQHGLWWFHTDGQLGSTMLLPH